VSGEQRPPLEWGGADPRADPWAEGFWAPRRLRSAAEAHFPACGVDGDGLWDAASH
jgi:hypothetical protein